MLHISIDKLLTKKKKRNRIGVKCKRKGCSLDTSQAYGDSPLCFGINLNKRDFNYVK